MSENDTAVPVERSLAAEFNAIVRRIDDDTLNRSMSDALSRELVLAAVFREMPARMRTDRTARERTVVRWRIGDPAAVWTVVVDLGGCTTHSGPTDEIPDVTVELEMVPFLRLIAGQVGGFALTATGRLRIKGNLLLARKLEDWFARE